MNDLSILIKTLLDKTSKQTLTTEINTLVSNLQKKFGNLNIKLNISRDALAGLEKLSKLSTDTAKKMQNIKQPVFDFAKPSKEAQLYFSRIDNLTKVFSRNNEILKVSKDEFGKVNMQVRNAEGLLKNYVYQWNSLNKVLRRGNRKDVDTSAQTLEKQLKEEQKINQNINKQRLKSQDDYNKEYLRGINLRQKAEQALQNRRLKLQDQENKEYLRGITLRQNAEKKAITEAAKLENYKAQAAIKAQLAQSKYGSLISQGGLSQYLASVNALKTNTPNLTTEMTRLSTSLKHMEANAQSSSKALTMTNKSSTSLTNALSNAMIKFPIWMAASTAFFQSLRFFTEGVQYVNEFNKSLTELSIVYLKNQDYAEGLGEQIRKLGKDMSIAYDELAKGTVEFARAGLDQQTTLDRMQTTIKYAKISNLQFSESAKIMTAAINSMGVTAEHAADVFSYMGDATASGKLCAA